MSQADAKHPFGECCEGQIPRPPWGEQTKNKLGQAPQLAEGYLTYSLGKI